jgi:hypothetical protein
MIVADVTRELEKVREALQWADRHLSLQNESDAALHCNPKVFYSPLTLAVREAQASVERMLVDLASEPDPLPQDPGALSSVLRALIRRANGKSTFLEQVAAVRDPATNPSGLAMRGGPITASALGSLPGAQAWALGHWKNGGMLVTPGSPSGCPWANREDRCCIFAVTRPLCHEALVAIGAAEPHDVDPRVAFPDDSPF